VEQEALHKLLFLLQPVAVAVVDMEITAALLAPVAPEAAVEVWVVKQA
jgi:hypothetical protein